MFESFFFTFLGFTQVLCFIMIDVDLTSPRVDVTPFSLFIQREVPAYMI